MKTLSSSIAGSWYPANPEKLRKLLQQLREELTRAEEARPEAPYNILILPHAGYCYSAKTALAGILALQEKHFQRVVLLAPSHHADFRDCFVAPESDAVATPLGSIFMDKLALEQLSHRFPVEKSDALHTQEHAAQIEYPLLQNELGQGFRILPLLVGSWSEIHLQQAATALKTILDEHTLLVISSDFTHYGKRFDFTPFHGQKQIAQHVKELDLEAFRAISNNNRQAFEEIIRRTHATICGVHCFRLLLQMVPEQTKWEMLAYHNSLQNQDAPEDFVCYLAAGACAQWQSQTHAEPRSTSLVTPQEQQILLKIARDSIENMLFQHRLLPPEELKKYNTPTLQQQCGCFVTLHHRNGELRGCIGEIDGHRPLVQAVAERALDAAFHDPRFYPVTAEEWGNLEIEISVLTPRRAVASYQEIEIGKHGMTLEKNHHMAVFLPQVAPGQGWDLATTLTHLARKAQLREDDWREGASFTVFEATVFREKRFL